MRKIKNYTYREFQEMLGVRTALIQACQQGDIEKVRGFLDEGADVDAQNKIGLTPLMWASVHGHVQRVVDFLGYDEVLVDDDFYHKLKSFSEVIIASINESCDLIRELVARGADVNIQDNNGNTALIWASLHGHTAALKILIGAGADVNIHNKDGLSALDVAYQYGHEETVNILIAAGVEERDGFAEAA